MERKFKLILGPSIWTHNKYEWEDLILNTFNEKVRVFFRNINPEVVNLGDRTDNIVLSNILGDYYPSKLPKELNKFTRKLKEIKPEIKTVYLHTNCDRVLDGLLERLPIDTEKDLWYIISNKIIINGQPALEKVNEDYRR